MDTCREETQLKSRIIDTLISLSLPSGVEAGPSNVSEHHTTTKSKTCDQIGSHVRASANSSLHTFYRNTLRQMHLYLIRLLSIYNKLLLLLFKTFALQTTL